MAPNRGRERVWLAYQQSPVTMQVLGPHGAQSASSALQHTVEELRRAFPNPHTDHTVLYENNTSFSISTLQPAGLVIGTPVLLSSMPSSLAVFASPGRYVQGRNATAELGKQAKAAGLESPILVVVDQAVIPLLGDSWEASLLVEGYVYNVVPFGGECSVAEIERVVEKARQLGAKTMLGFGGGKVLDTGRAAADRLGLPVVNCPTAASSDAPCSAASVVYTPEGVVDHYRFFKRHPALVLVDTTIIANAPKRLLVAGIGDALATYFETRTSYQAARQNVLNGSCSLTAMALARLCYDTLLADGLAACAAVEVKAVTPALERLVEANTLLSGLGFESGGLAVAHAVHNGLTVAHGSHAYLHGEKVSFGTLTQLVLEGVPQAELDTVYKFCCSVGLPVTLAQVGVDVGDRELLAAIAERATLPKETCHSESFQVTALAVRDAMLAADMLGRQYLARTIPVL